ncbi:MAG: radical SAM family heme chaperone HemW [Ruminiclostridium sp.]
MNKLGLYVHIPFCTSKCPYCDFYSVKYNCSCAREYMNAVIRNIEHYGETYDTVYFGGGTPILLWREICGIMGKIRLSDNAEVTIEANPCVTTKEALCSLKAANVNRISFGVQSLNNNELKALGRRHSAETAVKAINLAKECGFEDISADLMLAVPGQTKESVINSIDGLSALPLTHISAYLLKIEENTPFYSQKLDLPDEDETAEMYLTAVERLAQNGFSQYEISNFCRNGKACKHNLKYWRCEEYIGIGPAAHSYYKGKRFAVARDIDRFINSPVQQEEITDNSPHSFEEYAMLKLRLTEGLTFEECESFGVGRAVMEKRIRLTPKEYLDVGNNRISLTPKGFLVSNLVISKLIGY